MKIQRYKGTRDLSAPEMVVFRQIEGVFRERCLKYGYQEVRTPTLEYLHLFTSVGTLTPSMLGKVYSFLDWDGWSGERVVLRPDGTIPVARFYIDSMKGLARLFYIANMFIFDETGKKNRERWQCGAELIGAGSPVADTELIILSLEILRKLNIADVALKLSHAGFIKALLGKLGLNPEEQRRVFDQILDGNMTALAELKPDSPELAEALPSLLSLKGQSAGFLQNLKGLVNRSLPEIKPQLDDFIRIVAALEALGCDYQIDITSGTGFEYYTGLIFQLFVGEEKIGGGGRYDALIPAMGGSNVPASGFALYVDRLMNLVKPVSVAESKSRRILIRGQFAAPEALKQAFDIAGRLRKAGYTAELELDGRDPADFRWLLELQAKPLKLMLQDRVKNRRFEAKTVVEILKILEAEGAGKNRPA